MFGEYPITKMLLQLRKDNLLPAIVFRSSRRQCDEDIDKLAGSNSVSVDQDFQDDIKAQCDRICARYSFDPQIVFTHPQYAVLERCGAGAHHAGQLLVWRILLEELMSNGKMRMMIATGTVAAGVDFPARTVIITAHSKRGNEGFKVLTAAELQQMSGRAGRRGKDAVGICLVAPGPYADARVIAEVSRQPPEPLRSAYYAAPSTVLNLLKHRNVDDLRYTVERSLASFLDRRTASTMRQAAMLESAVLEEEANKTMTGERLKKAHKRVRRQLREANDLEQRQLTQLESSLTGLRKLGFVAESALTDKGVWAAELCTSLVLELAEAINDGLLDDLKVEELVAIVGSIAADPHRNYFSIKANPIKNVYFDALRGILQRVREAYSNPASAEVQVVPDAANTLLAWMDATDWLEFAGYLRLAGVAEGDISRLVGQTADHLNQISRLTTTHPVLAAAAEEGRRRILRPPLSDGVMPIEEKVAV